MRAGGEILPWIRSKMNSSASLVDQLVKNLPVMQKTWVQSLGWEDPLEKGMTTHSGILAWRIPWTEELGGLQSTYPWDLKESNMTEQLTLTHTFRHKSWWLSTNESICNAGDVGSIYGLGRSPGGENVNPFQYSCLGNPMDRGALQTSVHGVAKSQTRFSY